MTDARMRVLMIDDDPQIGAGIRRALHREVNIDLAADAAEALLALRDRGPFEIVVCDLSMPGMDGLSLMQHVRRLWPDVQRIMLSGEAQLQHALHAINDDLIFRFLLKPCSADTLRSALNAAKQQHGLLKSERELLEQTWRGSVAALFDVLALAQPAAFGRADRLAQQATELCEALKVDEAWRVCVAARLTQLGAYGVSASAAESLESGRGMSAEIMHELLALPLVAARILSHIPRLDAILEILRAAAEPPVGAVLPIEAAIVRVVNHIDLLASIGLHSADILDELTNNCAEYPVSVLSVLHRRDGFQSSTVATESVRLSDVTLGMRFASDVRTPHGLLLSARGQLVTQSLIDRIRNNWMSFASEQLVRVEAAPVGVRTVRSPVEATSLDVAVH